MKTDTTAKDNIRQLIKNRNKIWKEYQKSWNENIAEYTEEEPRLIDGIANQIRTIINANKDKLEVDFIIESLTSLGECPSILYDDNGFFAVTGDGSQEVTYGDEPTDLNTSFFVEAKQWKKTIREALYYYLDDES